jgi:hypothetical protein
MLLPSLSLGIRIAEAAVRYKGQAEKGDGSILPERPFGCFAQNTPVPFFLKGGCKGRSPLTCRPAGRTLAPMAPPIPILVITGQTATGKERLAVAVAERLGGEILSADSMKVYRGMDIGTAKAPPDVRRKVPHHLVDVADPGPGPNGAGAPGSPVRAMSTSSSTWEPRGM